ncbi:glutamyl-tRNA(Gln) amidotransferase subunit PET112 Ecym_7151 [Eremothecium cymbalariae DBVPG|uniref:Glutamyl-tRNA(Gln) amidotransferase subunit B, mitochondrial n=1 Tax=Eremothecium cymbalariae (strain CBS 270.75 / DBVPG 7215 / KCTC 17166 / NRRL Y-17582) TaxID=931890 RepID=G8JVY5_ERECY|nr:hypothetical protein Ecym_7151 [Eremothecium cymbalariae DBVPG\
MLLIRRLYSSRRGSGGVKFLPEYKLKCGLEIHSQLNTKNKLFSMSTNDPFHAANNPNYHTSYFDVSLPGTQPKLNYEAVLFASKLCLALQCDINLNSQFDRKHYFYGDQPLGYQITQHYKPFAKGGQLIMYRDLDNIDEVMKRIEIVQIQIEQDTGRSLYAGSETGTLIDLNRSNVPLIELVTKPQFNDVKQVCAFIKKYQNLLRHLKISTGDLETGAMRVDVNLSVNGNARVELKNLPNTSSIRNAIICEYQRQVDIIRCGKAEELLSEPQTRGWTGSETVKLRSKETTIDYRYMPDPELPKVTLSSDVLTGVASELPELPDAILTKLLSKPYSMSLKDAKLLTTNSSSHTNLYSTPELQEFYMKTFEEFCKFNGSIIESKLPANWIIHELLGNLNKLRIPLSEASKILDPKTFGEFLNLIYRKSISKASGKLLLFYVLNNFKTSGFTDLQGINFEGLIAEYELNPLNQVDETQLQGICEEILNGVDDGVRRDIISGKKKNAIHFLVGQGMKLSQGRIEAPLLENTFKKILGIKK